MNMTSVMDLFSLQDRTALVTGATRGIGQSLALALAEAGANVVLVQRNDSNTSTKEQIEKLGRKATIYTADLAVRDQLQGLIKRVLADGHDIDILVNCGEHHLVRDFARSLNTSRRYPKTASGPRVSGRRLGRGESHSASLQRNVN